MKKSLKTALGLGLVAAIGAGGTAIVANANANSDTTTAPAAWMAQAADSEANEGPENEANEGPDEENEADVAQASAQYQSLAKITAAQAQQMAEAAQGGTATDIELTEEDGSLVYEVEFGNVDVLVDAGDGKILKTETEGQEEDDATEVPIQGSIQVPDSDGGNE